MNEQKRKCNNYFNRLPQEIILKICSYLDGDSLCAFSKVNDRFYRLLCDFTLWEEVSLRPAHVKNLQHYSTLFSNLPKIKSLKIGCDGTFSSNCWTILLLALRECVELQRLSIEGTLRPNYGFPTCYGLGFPPLQTHLELDCLVGINFLRQEPRNHHGEARATKSLKYLSIEKCQDVGSLVSLIGEMKNLTTLKLSDCHIIRDSDLWTLINHRSLQVFELNQTNVIRSLE